MLIVIVTLIAAAGVLRTMRGESKWDQFGASVMVGLVGTLVALLFSLPLSMLVPRQYQTKEYAQHNIVSLRDSQGVQGRFTLGSGYISSQNYYVTYREVGPKRYEQITLNASDTQIVEGAEKPCYKVFETTRVKSKVGWWLNFNLMEDYRDYSYELHVPEGTLIQEFRIN